MFLFEELKQVHIEITTRCQASCPMCSRNYHGGLENPNLRLNDWTLDEFVSIFDNTLVNQLSGVYFCGNFGDPIINNDLAEMCEHLTVNNPDMSVRIHTNGSARSLDWWKKLPSKLPKDHVVVFALDGLADTHHIYRVGTKFEQILKNAQAFIEAGGVAEWVFIKFKHNEHQVDEAQRMATDIGFQRFSVKNSSRFLTDDKFDVYDENGNLAYYLEPPTENEIQFISKDIVNNVDKWLDTVEIECYVNKHKEIYMDAHRMLWPCCFLASTPYNHNEPSSIIHQLKLRAVDEYNDIVKYFGSEDALDLTKNHTKDIINSNSWQNIWQEKWSKKQLLVCAKTCGKSKVKQFSKPTEQIIQRINL